MSTQVVHSTRLVHSLLPNEQGVLRVLLYFDVFNHPLTIEEIFSFLPSRGLSKDRLGFLLRSGPLNRVVKTRGRFYFFRSASDSCIEERMSKERFARRRIRIAALVARFIGLFPFVRAVMLSGELSKGIASRNSDIDFAVITRSQRLWICRTILILFKKVFLFNSKKYFCLNHFISEDDLSVETRNIYSATEIATLKPLVNREYYDRYMGANLWVMDFFPNWDPSSASQPEGPSSLNGFDGTSERHILAPILDRLDHWLMIRWRRLWQRRYAHLAEEERRHMFRCDASISTAYGEDYQQKILTQYFFRLQQYGISGTEQRN
jgi:hypothetical protein